MWLQADRPNHHKIDGPSKYKSGERVKSFSQKVRFQLVTFSPFSDYGANLVQEALPRLLVKVARTVEGQQVKHNFGCVVGI